MTKSEKRVIAAAMLVFEKHAAHRAGSFAKMLESWGAHFMPQAKLIRACMALVRERKGRRNG